MITSHTKEQIWQPQFNPWESLDHGTTEDYSAAARFVGERHSEFLMLFHYEKRNQQVFMVNNTEIEPTIGRADPRFAVLAFMAELFGKNGHSPEVWEYVALFQHNRLPKEMRVTDHIVDLKPHEGAPRWTAPEYLCRPLETEDPGPLLFSTPDKPVFEPLSLA